MATATTTQEIEMTTTLTALEVQVLDYCLNYQDRESQLNDNYSNCDLSDAHKICGGKHEAAGVIGSLCKKGLVYDPASDEDSIIWLTEDGVNAIFDNKEVAA